MKSMTSVNMLSSSASYDISSSLKPVGFDEAGGDHAESSAPSAEPSGDGEPDELEVKVKVMLRD